MKEEESLLIPDEIITNKIYLIRNQKVMLDRDLCGIISSGNEIIKKTGS
jgi:hypothetical protein|tara:strand:- start:1833 stop:1979 length:147 start_codon:yes stop_codon:yes gene_type:complete